MSKSRLEFKVGLFVFLGLALLGILLLQFSKGVTFFHSTYDIELRSSNVGGLKPRAGVLMSGVQVGTVHNIRLSADGRNVLITLRILSQNVIHRDARFVLEQSGFLGDQYVAIVPTRNEAAAFKNGDVAEAEAPFNMQEFTRSASGFMTRLDDTVKKLNDSLVDVTRILLNKETLTNLAVMAANLRTVSERAITTVDNINTLLATNSPAVSESVSNLANFSVQLNQVAADLRGVLASNNNSIAQAVSNVEASTETLNGVMKDLQAGRGLAGKLLKNEGLAADVSQITSNLSITTSNLNRLGLWGILWKQKTPRTNEPAARLLSAPKDPYHP